MSVDLPAPFSPMREWISPARSVSATSSRALTPGKEMVMPVISTTGAAPGGGAVVPDVVVMSASGACGAGRAR